MNDPLVSVIIPTHNHGQYIGEAIESLLTQTYSHWELVVVDDGSTDNTSEVVAAFADPRITYLSEPHRGVRRLAETLNIGLRGTSGELVTMLGSDDRWPSYRLEKQVPVFRDSRVVLCFGRGVLIDSSGQVLSEIPAPSFVTPVMNRPVGSILGTLLLSNWLPQYTVLILRSALEGIGGYQQPEGLLAEDYPTHVMLALQGEFHYLDLQLGFYRMHPHQQTRMHKLEMTRRDVVWVMEFFQGLDPATRALMGLTKERLARALTDKLHNAYFEEGRRMLLRGDARGARKQFLTALRLGNPSTKVKAVVGFLCGLLGMDVEGLARLAGRPRFR